ncbi:MAG: YgiT-type zinc finger protein [Candidatus Tectomicrobia bacterium]|uniref:YgiT-type zinc finger protein n=1 Tax=Tectimicrobiota bacterium TaxID=2528274 RepID=A0A932CPT7_UNCTE|nr:YgiT-type zinc finger protein [Candidatus Tectomicrobia bacterium]
MRELMKSSCSECGGKVKRETISEEFEKEGVKVKLSGLKAWVCKQCGEIYFEPGGAEKVVQAVNSLFTLAFAEGQHKGKVTAHMS